MAVTGSTDRTLVEAVVLGSELPPGEGVLLEGELERRRQSGLALDSSAAGFLSDTASSRLAMSPSRRVKPKSGCMYIGRPPSESPVFQAPCSFQ